MKGQWTKLNQNYYDNYLKYLIMFIHYFKNSYPTKAKKFVIDMNTLH